MPALACRSKRVANEAASRAGNSGPPVVASTPVEVEQLVRIRHPIPLVRATKIHRDAGPRRRVITRAVVVGSRFALDHGRSTRTQRASSAVSAAAMLAFQGASAGSGLSSEN
jgi:hypothetical protein